MSNTYYTSLTGLIAASYGLQNTSNNVANLQSPGFKRNDIFYSSIGDSLSYDSLGSGVSVGGRSTNFRAGTYSPTGNPTDLAIVGDGFFIVRLKNGELLYTRDGEFTFNTKGFLEDKHSGGLVQGYDAKGALAPIREKGPERCLGKATHYIDLGGSFVIVDKEKGEPDPTPQNNKSDYNPISFELENIYDAKGKKHRIQLEFQCSDSLGGQNKMLEGRAWKLTKLACDGQDISIVGDKIELEFDGTSGSYAIEGRNEIKFTINNNQPIVLKFGHYTTDDQNAVKLYKKSVENTQTEVTIKSQDGYPEGIQTNYSFDDNGQISYHYNNGESIEGTHLALARFDDMSSTLMQAHDNLFRAKHERGRHISKANADGFGAIQAEKLESSNVDSTAEFAHIVVLQRMFQACSQIMDIDKQLVEGLYKK